MRKIIKKYFIPHRENNHKPHFLRKKTLSILVLFVFFVEISFFSYSFFLNGGLNYLASVLPGVLVTLTNEHRTQSKLSTLSTNSLLEKAAQEKANDMAAKGYFAHTSPDGKQPWYWLDKVGYNYTYAGENLAVNFVDSSDVTNAWMQSPTHRENIVNDHYTEIGIAVAPGVYKGRNTMFVVQFFGTPKVASITPPTQPVVQKNTTVPAPKPITTKTIVSPKVLGSETEITQNSPNTSDLKKEPNTPSGSVFRPIEKVTTNPRMLANYIFAFLILLVTAALALAVFIAIHIQHPAMIAGSISVIVLIAGMVYFNQFVVSRGVELPTDIVAATIGGL